MATPTVFEEKASYFNPTTKKWNSGTFTLQENCFRFQGDENNNKQNICIPLSTISGLEKRQSNLIFSCIVISVGSEKHWFSSFTNRDTVFNLLELFWRESLFSKSYRISPSKPKDADTQIGKELLGILHESESTLVSAANALVNQGKQLQESQMVMEDINTDLTVAEKFLRTFNLTHSILGIKDSASKTDEALVQKEPESVQQKHYKVTFTFSKEINEGWEKGTLVISDEVVLLDEHQNRKIELNVDAIEKFQILTPWEFCLIYSSGWASKSCYIMNPRLSGLLKYLNSIPNLKNKIVYEENPIEDAPSCSSGISNDIQPKLRLTD
ncbi:synaptosomal-associated protein 47 [Caerostris extrusa]|uniref:Synaptosomal-associated protein 47 n=1 Tax=Caerostris extrusa TaxID=172846 RepID=A0AAV4M9F9_CAEEX|nr:synaptosomal-associated protein 47 [Caerostris extrusa]